MAKVSVIVPVYNAEKFLKKCLSSLVNQTLDDIEIIVINDGSTDKSLQIMEHFKKLYNNKITIIDVANGGAGFARNQGLAVATGEFIKFVDADDYLNLDILDKMYHVAKENNVQLVRGNEQTIIGPIKMKDLCSWNGEQQSQIIDVRKNKDYIVTETSGLRNKLIGRDLLGDLKFPEQTKWEDLAIAPAIVASSEKLFHMNEPVYNYRANMNTTIKDFIYMIPNVLDIIKSLDYLQEQMKIRGLDGEYSSQLESIYILHTLYRVQNVMTWINCSKKKKDIVVGSLINILDLQYPNWRNDPLLQKYAMINPPFKVALGFIDKFSRDYNPLSDIEQIKSNVQYVLKNNNVK